METNKIIQGDALAILKTLPAESVDCMITSPPYWGLRDYGAKGQLGLEKTPEKYVANLVAVFSEIKRMLKKEGTAWLNLGDSYAGSGRGRDADGTWNPGKGGSKQETNKGAITGRAVNSKSFSKKLIEKGAIGNAWVKPPQGLKPKDLVGIPWRVAFALQADGWYLRQDIIWAKPNPMPESVTDRCTKSHEYIFLLSKSQKYYFDNEAIREPYTKPMNRWGGQKLEAKGKSEWDKGTGQQTYRHRDMRPNSNGRNRRSVWTITTKPYKEAHFATFPEKLIEPMVKAGCPKGGVVLDPFMGAGTTAVVARNLNREYLGIDLNPDYIKIAESRMAQGKLL